MVGRSSTQLADFIRRTAELAAIIASWAIYRATGRDMSDGSKKARLERLAALFVGLSMCLGGLAMALIALVFPPGDKGNVTVGLVIAVLGVITNSIFWLRYRRLNQREANAIIGAQSKLYRAKTLVDTCVTAALLTIALAPGSPAAYYMDIIGSVIVSVYLLIGGIGMVIEKKDKKNTGNG
jgi:divalent metal cation (Fe/Co/Zn/Cd) transporter